MPIRGHKSRQLRPSFLLKRSAAFSSSSRQPFPLLRSSHTPSAGKKFSRHSWVARKPGMPWRIEIMKRSSPGPLRHLSGYSLLADSSAWRHSAALPSGLLSQSGSDSLLQHERLGTWEPGLSLGLRQWAARQIQEFNSRRLTCI
jgi:hypothetical protein